MFGNLFKNPKAALVYVAITVFGVLIAVGTEENPGTLHQAVNMIGGNADNDYRISDLRARDDDEDNDEDREERVNAADRDDDEASDSDFFFGFASNEELIDTAEGFDPTPQNAGRGWRSEDSDDGDGSKSSPDPNTEGNDWYSGSDDYGDD